MFEKKDSMKGKASDPETREKAAISVQDVRRTYHVGEPVHALDGISRAAPTVLHCRHGSEWFGKEYAHEPCRLSRHPY